MSTLVGWETTNALRVDLARHCLHLDLPFHANHPPGELIERIDGDVSALSQFFSEFSLNIIGNSLLLIGILIFVSLENIYMGGILIVFASAFALILYKKQHVATRVMLEARATSATFFGFLEERLNAIDDIRTSHAGHYVMHKLYEYQRKYFYQLLRATLKSFQFGRILYIFFSLGAIAILAGGVYLNTLHLTTIGAVYLFFQYTTMMRQPLDQITRQIQDFQSSSASIIRLIDLLQTKSDLPDGTEDAVALFQNGSSDVAFDQVSFAYRAGEPVLSNISFKLGPGQVLGIVGRTGSGKSTIGRLLFRFYDVLAGSITLNGTDIRTLPLAELRRHIGLVTQDVQIFHATVRDNLTFFDPEIADDKILQVLDNLGLMDWYTSLPQGLETILVSGGDLSAGQAQLLAFARVFLKNPDFIILDEASSHLDFATEQLIERAMDALILGRTCIIIAHRLQTLRKVDRILVLEQGRVREYGSRETLVNDSTSYFSFLLRAGQELFV